MSNYLNKIIITKLFDFYNNIYLKLKFKIFYFYYYLSFNYSIYKYWKKKVKYHVIKKD